MDDDPEAREIRKYRSTWKDKYNYFLKLLENVLLTGVPQIVTETDRKRKIFKISVLFACLSGFLYHLISFILLYLTYPTSLEVLVKFQDISDLPKPTMTICDLNGIRRIPFCRDFPEKCEKPKNKEALCSKYNYFCSNTSDELMFPTFESFLMADYDRDTVIKYGTRTEDILNFYRYFADPIIYINSMRKLRNCYSIDLTDFDFNAILNSLLQDIDMYVSKGEEIGSLFIKFYPEDSFYPAAPIGAKISIHNKDQLVNPFVDGFFVKPGMTYNIQLKVREENLLGSPYSTNCTDYNAEEKSINGSYNRDLCLLECQKELSLKYCNCVTAEYNFHFHGNFCTEEDYDCIEHLDSDDCYDQCKISCKFTFFEYEVDESPFEIEEIVKSLNLEPDKDWWDDKKIWISTLNIYFKRPEILMYKYKPQYEVVEFFSYVGGYIGIWLGISLIAVCDFLEMFIIYCYYVFKGKIPVNREPKSKILLENKSLV